jgi:formamidopyrimidine-DNA glycosylase
LQIYKEELLNQIFENVTSKGKWVSIRFKSGNKLMINMGMGGDLLYSTEIPSKKYQAHIKLSNDLFLTFRFWWFGHIHSVVDGELHQMTDKLGIDLIRNNASKEDFNKILDNRKGSLKSFLLNQKNIAGIGNYYIHDILFQTKINPLVKIPKLSTRKKNHLFKVIIDEFKTSISKRGAHYELDIYNVNGEFKANKVAYKDGQLCTCGTIIKKIKTGSTTSYYCPNCQK